MDKAEGDNHTESGQRRQEPDPINIGVIPIAKQDTVA
jgi:hypothetical protein